MASTDLHTWISSASLTGNKEQNIYHNVLWLLGVSDHRSNGFTCRLVSIRRQKPCFILLLTDVTCVLPLHYLHFSYLQNMQFAPEADLRLSAKMFQEPHDGTKVEHLWRHVEVVIVTDRPVDTVVSNVYCVPALEPFYANKTNYTQKRSTFSTKKENAKWLQYKDRENAIK